MNAHFTCARCQRHRDGKFAAPSPRGVVCEGGCQPRECRCYCCDQHCDGRCPQPGDKGYNRLLHAHGNRPA